MRERLETDDAPEPVDDSAIAVSDAEDESETVENDFDGFDGSWDYEWVAVADQIMEEWPWTWIAVAVFVIGMVYSYVKNKR